MANQDGRVPPRTDPERLVGAVRRRYGEIALTAAGCCRSDSCCGPDTADVAARRMGYDESALAALPDGTNLGLGCGAPIALLELEAGETVLDMGSGAGIDALLAAREVGSNGRVIGVDMTPEMIARARANAQRVGATNVTFVEGRLESLPIGDATVDAVTSNCVINLVPDKGAVLREVARVLRPGGRVVVADIVLDGDLPPALAKDLAAYVGCVAGAIERGRYFDLIAAAGLEKVEVVHDVDYLAGSAGALPEAVVAGLEDSGVSADDLMGIVRSVTWRARARSGTTAMPA